MEEMANRFAKKFHLSEREAKGRKIGGEAAAAAVTRRKYTIVCRVLKHKPVHTKTFIEVFQKLWKGSYGVSIAEAEGERFLAVFGNEEDMKNVLAKEPWEFDNCLVVMAPLNSARSPTDVLLNSTPFWIQAWNIPPDYRIGETAFDIGNILGEYLDVKVNEKGHCIGVCVQTRIPIDVPLMRGAIVDFPKYPATTLLFRYERLPSFCQDCGMMDHPTRSCFVKRGVMNVPEKDRNFPLTIRAEVDVFGKRILTRLTHSSFSDSGDDYRREYSRSDGPSWRKRDDMSTPNHSNDRGSVGSHGVMNSISSNASHSLEGNTFRVLHDDVVVGPSVSSPLKCGGGVIIRDEVEVTPGREGVLDTSKDQRSRGGDCSESLHMVPKDAVEPTIPVTVDHPQRNVNPLVKHMSQQLKEVFSGVSSSKKGVSLKEKGRKSVDYPTQSTQHGSPLISGERVGSKRGRVEGQQRHLSGEAQEVLAGEEKGMDKRTKGSEDSSHHNLAGAAILPRQSE